MHLPAVERAVSTVAADQGKSDGKRDRKKRKEKGKKKKASVLPKLVVNARCQPIKKTVKF